MKEKFLKSLLFVYTNYIQSDFLKRQIKNQFGKGKINLHYNDFAIKAGVISSIEADLVFGIYNEKAVLETITTYAKKGFHFLDIGANIGLHSLAAAQANSEIEIYSFEPEPNNFADFLKNISLNDFKNIRPFKIALGNKNCVEELYVNQGWNKGKHSLKKQSNLDVYSISIPIMKLDDFNEIINHKNMIVKIDVEGFENEVIEGSVKFLENLENSVLIIELLEEINSREKCINITNSLQVLGFDKVYRYVQQDGLLEVEGFSGSSDYLFSKGNV